MDEGEKETSSSWDSYIDNLIAQTADSKGDVHADKACIIGIEGGAPWTTSGHPNALKVHHNDTGGFIVRHRRRKQGGEGGSRPLDFWCY